MFKYVDYPAEQNVKYHVCLPKILFFNNISNIQCKNPIAYCCGNHGDANFMVGLQKYIIRTPLYLNNIIFICSTMCTNHLFALAEHVGTWLGNQRFIVSMSWYDQVRSVDRCFERCQFTSCALMSCL